MSELDRALAFGTFLDGLSAPTPAQQWLERAAAELGAQESPETRARKASRSKIIARLMQRDGHSCWFCAEPLGDDVTIEHLHPRMMGGSWHEDNLALAHARCNKAAGHLSRTDKERLKERWREENPAS